MRNLLEKYLYSYPRDGAGTGGGGAGGAPPAGGAGNPPAGAPGGSPASETPPAGGAAPGGELYFPEGFPDQMRGKDGKETLDNAWTALKGYRDRDATRDVPADPAGYLTLDGLKDFSLDETMKPHFEALKQDKSALAMFEKAKEHGLDRRATLDIWQAGMKALADGGMLEPMLDPAAERAALLPDAAKTLPKTEQDAAIDRRMQENYDFLDLMSQNRGLSKEARDYAEMMLGDSAKGHGFFEWMRGQLQGGEGGGPGAHGSGQGGGDTAASLKAEMGKPELTAGHPMFDREAYKAFDERYKRFHAGQK